MPLPRHSSGTCGVPNVTNDNSDGATSIPSTPPSMVSPRSEVCTIFTYMYTAYLNVFVCSSTYAFNSLKKVRIAYLAWRTQLLELFYFFSCCWGPVRVNSDRRHSSETATWRSWDNNERQATGRNSDSNMWTFRNCDVGRFEIQTGDIKTPPNRASFLPTPSPALPFVSPFSTAVRLVCNLHLNSSCVLWLEEGA